MGKQDMKGEKDKPSPSLAGILRAPRNVNDTSEFLSSRQGPWVLTAPCHELRAALEDISSPRLQLRLCVCTLDTHANMEAKAAGVVPTSQVQAEEPQRGWPTETKAHRRQGRGAKTSEEVPGV